SNYQGINVPSSTFNITFNPPNIYTQANAYDIPAGTSVVLTTTVNGSSKTIAPTGAISFKSFFGYLTGPISAPVTYSTIVNPTTGNLDLQAQITITPSYTESYSSDYG